MTIHYFDPSAWVKRHFQELGSEAVSALFRANVSAACCRLGLLEMIATIARKGHGESLEAEVVDSLVANVSADFAAFRNIPVDEPLLVKAADLTLHHRLRTMDAIHLAAALSLQGSGEVVMISADAELLAAAVNEGLSTLNPSLPP